MFIKELTLTNFRNHKKATFNFSKGVNLILGPNTSGKSNVLEVLYFLATGSFIKASLDGDIIAYNESFCRIDAVVNKKEDTVSLSSAVVYVEETDKTTKTYEVNKIKRAKNKFLGNFYAVLFTPESLELVTDSPSIRREYMDFVLSQTDPKYRVIKPLYDKVVRNRNRILEKIRDTRVSSVQLDYWDMKTLEYGIYIQNTRDAFFNFVDREIGDTSKLLGLKNLKINYLKNPISKERLQDFRLKDIQAGVTLIGPHRDDFEFLLQTRNLKSFGSRGEQRTGAIALKMRELAFIRNELNNNPTLLLDDIFSELDEKHRETIINICQDQQTIITSAEKDLVPKPLIALAKTFYL